MIVALLSLLIAYDDVQTRVVPIGLGWARNSVNATVFRQSSVTSFGDTQYVAFYDPDGYMVLAKRSLSSTDWETNRTPHKGNVADAHNGISIAVDGQGYLHVAWDHHGHPLNYATAVEPGSLSLGERRTMTGSVERSVTYPQFFNLPEGRLLFFYRDGGSGNGNLVLNRYDPITRQWRQLHANLIDGEGERNAYWQAHVGISGRVYVSWVWRETGDVATNHDLCYAYSPDAGETWNRSDGTKYEGRITAATAEV
ncbi:MAG: BNR repeat-containing protein, partial [Armatimonadetes bacterium]|nr:BNR repeat-containing protein [Armatimonadota bacterium]